MKPVGQCASFDDAAFTRRQGGATLGLRDARGVTPGMHRTAHEAYVRAPRSATMLRHGTFAQSVRSLLLQVYAEHLF